MTSSTKSAAAAAAEVQSLLRFLAQDARVPLSIALSKINNLRKAKLDTPEAISKVKGVADLSLILGGDEKVAKQVLTAARRVIQPPKSKKRPASGDDAGVVPTGKRARGSQVKNGHDQLSPAESEASLALPRSSLSVQDLRSITIQTNRAPLLLAFAVTLLKYTMAEQPLSSRLSLAQAVVSANSRTKAHRIGLVAGKSAEDEGWGEGQPRAKVMGRMIPVMRRSGYDIASPSADANGDGMDTKGEEGEEKEAEETEGADGSPATIRGGENSDDKKIENRQLPPLWGLDLEALRKLNNPARPTIPHLPIHTPQSARTYLLKSFTIVQPQRDPQPPNPSDSSVDPPSKNPIPSHNPIPSSSSSSLSSSSSSMAKQNSTAALSHLLLALDFLFSSWASNPDHNDNDNDNDNNNLDPDLDSKAWGWYVRIRPDVQHGERGWGQKGWVGLGSILSLMKGC